MGDNLRRGSRADSGSGRLRADTLRFPTAERPPAPTFFSAARLTYSAMRSLTFCRSPDPAIPAIPEDGKWRGRRRLFPCLPAGFPACTDLRRWRVHIAFRLFDDQLARRPSICSTRVWTVLFRHAIQKCIQQFGVREQVAGSQCMLASIILLMRSFLLFWCHVGLCGVFLFGGKTDLYLPGATLSLFPGIRIPALAWYSLKIASALFVGKMASISSNGFRRALFDNPAHHLRPSPREASTSQFTFSRRSSSGPQRRNRIGHCAELLSQHAGVDKGLTERCCRRADTWRARRRPTG